MRRGRNHNRVYIWRTHVQVSSSSARASTQLAKPWFSSSRMRIHIANYCVMATHYYIYRARRSFHNNSRTQHRCIPHARNLAHISRFVTAHAARVRARDSDVGIFALASALISGCNLCVHVREELISAMRPIDEKRRGQKGAHNHSKTLVALNLG